MLAGLFTASDLKAQGTSPADTLTFLEAYGLPGDTVAVTVFLVNNSIDVASWNLQYRIDTSVIKPIVVEDNGDLYPTFELIGPMIDWVPFGAVGAELRYFPDNPLGPTVTGIFPGDPDIPVVAPQGGRYGIMKIFFEVQEGVALNTETTIDIFSDFSVSGGIIITISDPTGLEIIEPTLVDGTLIVKDTTITPDNQPPVIDPISPITAGQGDNVSFTVRATDPEGDGITLSSTNLPAGATFPQATGAGEVSQVFTWNNVPAGTYSVTFRAVDSESNTASRSVTINVQEIVTDNLYVNSTETLGVRGGIAGTTAVPVPIDLQDIRDVYGVQFDIEYMPTICRVDSVTATDRLPGFTVYENLNYDANKIRVVTFGVNNEVVQAGSSGRTILNIWTTINNNASPGFYPFKITEAWESITPDPNAGSIELEYDSLGLIAVDMLGDVNLHPPVDVADVVSLIGYIIGNWSLSDRQFRAANVNADTEANVVDMVAILNYILGMSANPAPFANYTGDSATIDIDYGDLYAGELSTMSINADLPSDVSGVQFEIKYDPEMVELDAPELSSRSHEFEMKYSNRGDGKMVVLMYYKSKSSGRTIPAGLGDLLSVPVRARGDVSSSSGSAPIELSRAILSSPEGATIPVKGFGNTPLPTRFSLDQNYPNPFNPRTTITFEILASPSNSGGQEIELVIYNILGQKVKTLLAGYYSPGEYTVEWDGSDESGTPQASGVYFYSLISEKARVTKKMVLQK